MDRREPACRRVTALDFLIEGLYPWVGIRGQRDDSISGETPLTGIPFFRGIREAAGRAEGRCRMPKTKLGTWAGVLLAAFIGLLIALVLAMRLAGLAPGTPFVLCLGTSMMISGIAAFVSGAIALIRLKDRSFVVILAVVLGCIASFISVMETVEAILWRFAH